MRSDLLVIDERELEAALTRESLGDVEIGREVRALRQDPSASLSRRRPTRRWKRHRGAQGLEEIHRCRIGDDDLAGSRADEPRDLVADALREIDPAGGRPAANQPDAPLGFDDVADAIDGGFGQHAKRVAVEIDDACGIDAIEREQLAQRRQLIARVLVEAVVPVHCDKNTSTDFTDYTDYGPAMALRAIDEVERRESRERNRVNRALLIAPLDLVISPAEARRRGSLRSV